MRESIGSTWIFTLVITFTLIFAGFLVLALSYSKAYKIKNEMTSMIEKYEGLTKDNKKEWGSVHIINSYLSNAAYTAMGKCEVGDYATDDLTANGGTNLIKVTSSNVKKDYYYCLKYIKDGSFYNVTVFYDFNLPIFGLLHKYSISGQTNELAYCYNDYGSNKKCA